MKTVGFPAVAVLAFGLTAIASATVRHVPADFAAIQAAIDASSSGDTVLVAPGVYTENLDLRGRALRLLSSDGAEATTLSPAFPEATLVLVSGVGVGAELAGFTLDGGSMKHAILIDDGSAIRIHHNVIRNHISYQSNATEIGSYSGTSVIDHNLFVHNRSIGGVGIFAGGGQILHNTFHDNSRGFWSQGSGVVAKNNVVTNSVQFGIGDNRFAFLDYNCVFGNNPDYGYGAVPGTNDIVAWPEYCDTATGNFGLDVISPCLATGEGGIDRGAYGLACGADGGPRVTGLTVSGEMATHVLDNTPDIKWVYFDLANLPQLESEIEVGVDADWTVAEMWDPPAFPGASNIQTYAGAELLDGTTYHIRARVSNGSQWGLWTSRTFHMNAPPPPPVLEAPIDGGAVTTAEPVLYLSRATDPEGDAQTFGYEVYADAALSVLVASSTNQPEAWRISPPLPQENQTYWWRARASDMYQTGVWSEAAYFVLDEINSPPVAGALLEPVDNVPVPSRPPYFDWEDPFDPDPSPGVLIQTLIIATDSQFTFATQFSDLPQSNFTLGGLGVAQRYWWKVRVADQAGLWSETPAERFYIPGPGDMNMNQALDLVDVVLVIDVVFRGAAEPAALYLADVNGDCVIDVRDVVRIIEHSFRGGPLPLSLCATGASHRRVVPIDYATITSALLAAADDDTILVMPGIYRENIRFYGKGVHLVGEGGPGVTTLEPAILDEPTVRFDTGEPAGTSLSGFTLTGGDGKHAILVSNGASPHIHHNIIRDHVSYENNATAIGSYDANPAIEYNLILHTRSLGGIGIFSGGGAIINNTFDDNSRGYWSQGVGVVARNNIVTNSVQFGVGDDGFAVNDYNCLFNNVEDYCCGAAAGPNDVLLDPLYCDRAVEDFSLGPRSPALGSGADDRDRGAFPGGCQGR